MRLMLRSVMACLLGPLLSGCMANAYVVPPMAALIEPRPYDLLLTGRHGQAAEQRRVTNFIYASSRGRLDAVHLDVIGTSPQARQSVVRTALRMGVTPYKIKG